MEREKSIQYFEEAKKLFPGGVNSPVRAFRSVGGTPLFIDKGADAHIFDADGNKYLDFCCSWGPLLHGHAHPDVVKAAKQAIDKGSSFGAPTLLENQLASLIIGNNPFIEKIRFVSSGTEAVMSAIRLARGYTGKNKILKFEGCYHGHSDSLLVKAGSGLVTFGNSSSAGVPESFVNETIVCPLNNTQAVEEAFNKFKNEIACVIIEPVPANNGLLLQEKTFLNLLRTICTQYNTLLIFDEVISGFRLGFTGAAGYYNIQPDIITYGKIIGGGFPVGAYAASEKIMNRISPEGNVYQAGTLSGNPVAMAAGIAQLTLCLQKDFYRTLEEATLHFCNEIRTRVKRKDFKIFSIASIFWIAFTELDYIRSAEDINPQSMTYFNLLYKKLLENGIYLGPSGYEVGFISSVHDKDELTQAAIKISELINEL